MITYFNQIPIHYTIKGKGPSIVLLHGFLLSSPIWVDLAPKLSKKNKIITIDLPGHGKSECISEIHTMELMAEVVNHILEENNISIASFIGHSMGGYISLEMKRLDSACDKVVLMNSNFWADSQLKKEDRKRIAKLVKTKKAAFINTAIPGLFMNPDEQFTEVDELIKEAIFISEETVANCSIAMSLRNDNTQVVKDNVDDVLIVQGVLDSVVSQQMMHKKIKGLDVSFTELPCGQKAHIECSVSLKNEMMNFLTKKNGNF